MKILTTKKNLILKTGMQKYTVIGNSNRTITVNNKPASLKRKVPKGCSGCSRKKR